MSIILTDEAERVVDISSEFNQTAVHVHEGSGFQFKCPACLDQRTPKPLPFVPPSQGARIAELQRLVSQQEGDLNQACRKIATQGQTIRMVRRDLIDLLSKAKAGVEITYYDIANIIPDEPESTPEYLKAA